MRFVNGPIWWMLLTIPLVVYLLYYLRLRSLKTIPRWFDLKTVVGFKPDLKFGLRVAAFVLTIVALLGPYFKTSLLTVTAPEREVYILLDVSASMNADDVQPTRLKKAKSVLKQLLPKLKGDKVGLISFTNFTYVQCPATKDMQMLELFVDILETNQFGKTGTNIRKALQAAFLRFEETKPTKPTPRSKCVLLITDGENNSTSYFSILSLLKQTDVTVIPIGVGTTRGARVPAPEDPADSVKKEGFIRDEKGMVVTSRLNDTTLKTIAEELNTNYFVIDNHNFELEKLSKTIGALPVALSDEREQQVRQNIYQWLLALAIVAFSASLFLSPKQK